MKRAFPSLMAGLMASVAFAAEAGGAAAAVEETVKKSIVPGKYNDGRYKNGGSDPVAEFIKAQSYDKGEVVPESFFSLCRQNLSSSMTEEKIAHYEGQVAEKKQGAAGRARMTLGNILRAMARKNGSLNDQSGKAVAIEGLEKPAVSGAAAKAQETKAEDAGKTDDETTE